MLNGLCGSLLLASVLTALPLWGDPSVQRQYQFDNYQRIYLHGNAQLHLHQAEPGVDSQAMVSGASERLARLRFESADGVLYIDAGDAVDELVIEINVSELKEIVSDGNAQIYAQGLTQSNLALEGRGASKFELKQLKVDDLVVVGQGETEFEVSGSVAHQFVELAGVGQYRAEHLASQTSHVNVRGAGQIAVWVDELLDVTVLGAAKVSYIGTPWVLQQISGSGDVQRMP